MTTTVAQAAQAAAQAVTISEEEKAEWKETFTEVRII